MKKSMISMLAIIGSLMFAGVSFAGGIATDYGAAPPTDFVNSVKDNNLRALSAAKDQDLKLPWLQSSEADVNVFSVSGLHVDHALAESFTFNFTNNDGVACNDRIEDKRIAFAVPI